MPKVKPAPAKFKIGDQVKRHRPSSNALAAEIGTVVTIPPAYHGRRVAVVWMRADGTGYRRCYELAYLNHAGGEAVKAKTNIAAEIIAACGHTPAQIGEMLELSPSYPYKLATGEKSLDSASREIRHVFLSFASAIPEKSRSAELGDWIERTEKYFEEKPLGGVFL